MTGRLPEGTVTFLFTDVVGSTALWEHFPAEAAAAMARHDEIIEDLVSAHGGSIVRPRGEGDSRFGVFGEPVDALRAAAAIGAALSAEAWPTPRPLQVRMAAHTGEADLRAGDYYGSDVNRCARLRAIGHPGQILVSSRTAEGAVGELPHSLRLDDLGVHRLKDLSAPEHVFQLSSPAVGSEFPPLRSLDMARHNLPHGTTTFIGRDLELTEVRKVLEGCRMVTLTGVGGTGKTRLALELGAAIVDDFPGGVWLAELAPVADPALVPQTLATAMGVSEEPHRSLTETMAAHLAAAATLVLLDNCEHLLDASASLADALLTACPELRVLATSREPLAVSGEAVWAVPTLDPFAATQLFVERAQAADASFVFGPSTEEAVEQICTRLDGIPLAIELAASRVRALPPAVLAARLDDRFALLVRGPRTVLPRHQTLRTTIDWSHDLLTTPEQTVLRRLSVFAGSFALDAAEVVCADVTISDAEVVDLVSSLVDKSLVVPGDGRYRMLETVRAYAAERMVDIDELAQTRRHLAEWLCRRFECLERDAATLSEIVDGIETERENLRAALVEAQQQTDATLALRLAVGARVFWSLRGLWSEGRQWVNAALDSGQLDGSTMVARALLTMGELVRLQGALEPGRAYLEESVATARVVGDDATLGEALSELGDVLSYEQRLGEARVCLDEAVAILSSVFEADPSGFNSYLVDAAVHNRASVAIDEGDYAGAKTVLEAQVARQRASGESFGLGASLAVLGHVRLELGDDDGAESDFSEALRLTRETGDQRFEESVLRGLGQVAFVRGDTKRARGHVDEARDIIASLGDAGAEAIALLLLAEIAEAEGDYASAAELLSASDEVRRDSGLMLPAPRMRTHDRLRLRLGDKVSPEEL